MLKNGKVRGKQRYRCQECKLNFIEGDERRNPATAVKKALSVILYAMGKASFNMLGKLFGHSRSLIYRYVVEAMDHTAEPAIAGTIQEMEFDEMWHFIGSKKNKKWILKAVDRSTRRTVAWVVGGRDAATFQHLYDKVKHLNKCTFYTGNWDAFAHVLPPERHVIGKAGMVCIKQDNSNTRHHLARFTRRSKVVSKKLSMVYDSLKLWSALTSPAFFLHYQTIFLSIFR